MKASSLTKETILDRGIQDRNFPAFQVGDTIEVAQLVKDGEKQRIQIFRGDVIADHHNGIASTFTVRKISANGIGVEKIFPYHSKNVDDIKLIKKGKVRRAKLNYIRKRVGKSARVKEKIITKEQIEQKLIAEEKNAQIKDSTQTQISEQKDQISKQQASQNNKETNTKKTTNEKATEALSKQKENKEKS